MIARGKLFVFEGPDGVGKTTIAKNLTRSLQASGVPCEYLAFPGAKAGTLGMHVYRLHHRPETFEVSRLNPSSLQVLHVAAHIEAIEGEIFPLMRAGTAVVLDRYWWSTFVYGRVSGVPLGGLEAMVHLELSYWSDTRPTVAFLLRREVHASAGGQLLTAGYEELASQEEKKYRVESISNDGAPEQTLNRVLALCG